MTPMLLTLESYLPRWLALTTLFGLYALMLLAILLISGPGESGTIYIDLRS